MPVDEVELEEDPSDRPAMTCGKSVEEPTGAVPDHLETCIKLLKRTKTAFEALPH